MNNRLKSVLCLVIFLFSLSSCSKWLKDEELTLPKTPYTGNELRTDGYYYYTMTGEYFGTLIFFYENGVAFQPIGGCHSLQELDEYVLNKLVGENSYHDVQWSWELFNIENDRILINYWTPPMPFQCFIEEGTILNDTTYVIQRYYRMVDGEKTEETETNKTYHFRQFSPKPDSTNLFIQ